MKRSVSFQTTKQSGCCNTLNATLVESESEREGSEQAGDTPWKGCVSCPRAPRIAVRLECHTRVSPSAHHAGFQGGYAER